MTQSPSPTAEQIERARERKNRAFAWLEEHCRDHFDDLDIDALDVLLAAEVARALEQAERHLDAKAFACHAHDDFGRGRERGVLEACVYLRSLIPAAPEKNDG